MHVHNGRYPSGRDTSLIHVDEEKYDVEEERPDDAVTCPLLDTPIHFYDCQLCRGRGWVHTSDISAYLGPYRVPCVSCGGEGDEESGGPVTWTSTTCLGDEELLAALHQAGYTGQIDIVDAVHTSLTAEADPEVGYAALITNPDIGRGSGGITDRGVSGVSGTYPPRPVGGSVPPSDWGGEPRQRFREAVADLRRRADAATERLAAAEPWYRRRVAAAIGKEDLPWKVDPALAQRRIDLAATGGTAPNFPIGEDAFARVAARSLGTTPDDPSVATLTSLDPRLDEAQNVLLKENTLKDGRTWERVLEDEAARVRADFAKVRESGVTWGPRATPDERLAAASGMPDVQKIIKRYNDERIDLSGQNLRGATFDHCDFSNAIFDSADLTNATFEDCQFAGANPEAASSLAGTRLEVTGLSAEQRATCAARGAIVVDLDDEEED